ncbi:hypothetical protein FQZ97_981140 [compost metagenome]
MPSSTSQANEGATEKPTRASAVIRQLAATTTPVPTRATMRPAKPALSAAQTVMVRVSTPRAARGWPMSARIAGQITPMTASGSPRLTNDT